MAFNKFLSFQYDLYLIDFLFISLSFGYCEKILYNPGLPRIHSGVKVYCELPILLPQSSYAWNYKFASTHLSNLVFYQSLFMN